MTITLKQSDYWGLFDAIEQGKPERYGSSCSLDKFDVIWKYPTDLGQGFYRTIELREGLDLAIANYKLHDHLMLTLPEREHPIEYSFLLSGQEQNHSTAISTGHYVLYSSGIAPNETNETRATEQTLVVNVHIEPELFRTFLGQSSLLSSSVVQKLVGNPEQCYSAWSSEMSAAMQMAVQQIVSCPYQGLTKRIYLEAKVWELMALLIEQIAEPPVDRSHRYTLKTDDVDRIHHAKEILQQQLHNPPSLIELARQVGLNDCTLKRGFRQVLGTTAFGYLHRYRLERARHLLETGEMNVAEVAKTVGFADRSYFSAAFRKQFGCNPGVYRRSHQQRLNAS